MLWETSHSHNERLLSIPGQAEVAAGFLLTLLNTMASASLSDAEWSYGLSSKVFFSLYLDSFRDFYVTSWFLLRKGGSGKKPLVALEATSIRWASGDPDQSPIAHVLTTHTVMTTAQVIKVLSEARALCQQTYRPVSLIKSCAFPFPWWQNYMIFELYLLERIILWIHSYMFRHIYAYVYIVIYICCSLPKYMHMCVCMYIYAVSRHRCRKDILKNQSDFSHTETQRELEASFHKYNRSQQNSLAGGGWVTGWLSTHGGLHRHTYFFDW